jgi:hypothetical protein
MDTNSASGAEKLTDNNTFVPLLGYQCIRLSETLAVPIPNSRLEINNSNYTINHKDQQNLFYPMSDIKYNENQLQKPILCPKFNKPGSSCPKKNDIQNDFSCHVNQENMNKGTEICTVNPQKVNEKHMKYISNVSRIDENFTSLPIQHTFVQEPPLEDCLTGTGTEMNTDEDSPQFSCGVFDTSGSGLLDDTAFDKLQNSGHQAHDTDSVGNEGVAQSANCSMIFRNISSIMEDDFHKDDSELCQRHPNESSCSGIQAFVTVTHRDKHLKECVTPQLISHIKDVGTGNQGMSLPEDESQKISDKATEISENCILHETEFQSNAVKTLQKKQISHRSHKVSEIEELRLGSSIQLKSDTSSKASDTKCSNVSLSKEEFLPIVGEQLIEASDVKEKHENKFLQGRNYTPVKRKLEIAGMFQKRFKTKNTCSKQQTSCSEVCIGSSKTGALSTIDIKNVTSDIPASIGRNKRKTKFQAPFKKTPSQANQVHIQVTHSLPAMLVSFLQHGEFQLPHNFQRA